MAGPAMIHPTAIVHPRTTVGDGSTVGPYALIGEPARGTQPGEVGTIIGPRACIRSHTVIYAGNVIGADFQTGHGVLIRELNTIGDEVSVGSHAIVEHHVTIGSRVRIHSDVFIPEYSVLEAGVWIGPAVVFTNASYPASPSAKQHLLGPRLCEGARVGANATLLPGIVVGRNALIGAGAVVVADVPEGKVVVGNPARIIKDISEIPAYGQDALLGRQE